MSNFALTWVWKHSRARGTQRLVLLSIADQANDDGEAWPSVGSLSQRCLVAERQVQRAVVALIESGELVREERFTSVGRQTSSLYRVSMGRVTLTPPSGVHSTPPLEPKEEPTGAWPAKEKEASSPSKVSDEEIDHDRR